MDKFGNYITQRNDRYVLHNEKSKCKDIMMPLGMLPDKQKRISDEGYRSENLQLIL